MGFDKFKEMFGFGKKGVEIDTTEEARTAEEADATLAEIEQADREEVAASIQGMEMTPGEVVKEEDDFDRDLAQEATPEQLAEVKARVEADADTLKTGTDEDAPTTDMQEAA